MDPIGRRLETRWPRWSGRWFPTHVLASSSASSLGFPAAGFWFASSRAAAGCKSDMLACSGCFLVGDSEVTLHWQPIPSIKKTKSRIDVMAKNGLQ